MWLSLIFFFNKKLASLLVNYGYFIKLRTHKFEKKTALTTQKNVTVKHIFFLIGVKKDTSTYSLMFP